MSDVIEYYDGIQLAYMKRSRTGIGQTYLAVHSVDDGVFLASRISTSQKKQLEDGIKDVKTVMMQPYKGELYIVLDPLLLPISQQNRMKLDEYCGIPVEYDPVFDEWALPSPGLFITDIR
ncbi:MAG: hypothetical protein M0R77_20370 [Gammaproteobacteria bacterium]|nr:hypothetical protein [Gammaproteobacteria bacterium]